MVTTAESHQLTRSLGTGVSEVGTNFYIWPQRSNMSEDSAVVYFSSQICSETDFHELLGEILFTEPAQTPLALKTSCQTIDFKSIYQYYPILDQWCVWPATNQDGGKSV